MKGMRMRVGERVAARRRGCRARLRAAVLGLLLAAPAGAAVAVLWPGGQMWALEAAGAFKGQAIGGVEHFVSALRGNLVWLGGTAMGLVIAVVGILFLAGHSRAHDLALKTIIGLAILASISGIVA